LPDTTRQHWSPVLSSECFALFAWRIGTFVIGAIAGTLVYATIGLTMYGRNEVLWVTPVLGLATGGLAWSFKMKTVVVRFPTLGEYLS